MGDVTKLLVRIAEGDLQAWDELYPLTEPELRKLALHWIKKKDARDRVPTTVVIDDAFVKLMQIDSPNWQHRGAFYMFASRNILWILINYLRPVGPQPSPIDPDELESVNGLSVHTLLTLHKRSWTLGRPFPRRTARSWNCVSWGNSRWTRSLNSFLSAGTKCSE